MEDQAPQAELPQEMKRLADLLHAGHPVEQVAEALIDAIERINAKRVTRERYSQLTDFESPGRTRLLQMTLDQGQLDESWKLMFRTELQAIEVLAQQRAEIDSRQPVATYEQKENLDEASQDQGNYRYGQNLPDPENTHEDQSRYAGPIPEYVNKSSPGQKHHAEQHADGPRGPRPEVTDDRRPPQGFVPRP